ncbi:MAG: hypothetical protein A3G34_00750 [Candidatus Lindowbacteria bacterium RIFCSPLOWO2_12_FULL_62_27]|nr:MAG: hypothetical protein A3G34_00750 [Candidatus Lindowbacteria bacterium RIFCSPLOWO2_12_FULL_62_27]OGH58163.1 MAG: hypothetical protein A3I06_00800 [Candidatus Lindowbacteria bacterium RIFCSPLOWO2_02_FULL_62_12]
MRAQRTAIIRLLVALAFFLYLPLTDFRHAAVAGNDENAYYRKLLVKREATVEDAIHVVARFYEYEGETNMLKELNFLLEKNVAFRRDINKMAGQPLTKGDIANLMMNAMGKRSGMMSKMFPNNQRYALREAIKSGLFGGDSTVMDRVAGNELLGLLGQMQEKKEAKK